ncbi:MAG: hypothetical protein RBT59_08590 [Arcobacteraceae bacterium]|jgi:hypothetical protein|nr:hypothetical protein [Arcobacteraceae bacterium]
MKYKTIIFSWLFCYSFIFANCEQSNQKNYNYNFDNAIVTFILVNHNFLFSDIQTKNGEYLDSLLTQLNLKNDDTTLNNLIDLVNKYPNAYDFAVAITKDKI